MGCSCVFAWCSYLGPIFVLWLEEEEEEEMFVGSESEPVMEEGIRFL